MASVWVRSGFGSVDRRKRTSQASNEHWTAWRFLSKSLVLYCLLRDNVLRKPVCLGHFGEVTSLRITWGVLVPLRFLVRPSLKVLGGGRAVYATREPCKVDVFVALNAGQDKAGRLDVSTFCNSGRSRRNADNADSLPYRTKNRGLGKSAALKCRKCGKFGKCRPKRRRCGKCRPLYFWVSLCHLRFFLKELT